MPRLHTLAGLALLVAVLVWFFGANGDFTWLVDLPSILLVVLLPLAILLINFSPADLHAAVRAAAGGAPDPERPPRACALVFRTAFQSVIHAGLIGTVFSFVQMLRDLSDAPTIAAGLSFALMPTGYALLIGGLLIKPLETAVLRRVAD